MQSTHHYFNDLQEESTVPDEKVRCFELVFFFWGGDNLLVFQKLLALVFSIQINCYLFDPDAFFL